MLVALLIAAVCSAELPSPGRQWLEGDYRALPVLRHYQDDAFGRLADSQFESIGADSARRLTGQNELPVSLKYYLARTGYHGDEHRGSIPIGVHIGLDVDSTGLGVIVSFRFTDSPSEVEVAAVLVSETEITRLMTRCIRAE